YFKEKDHLVIVDNSEVIKPHAHKLEALGKVRDGSTGRIEEGYWTTNMISITPTTKHPISLYSHLFSSTEKEFISQNEETNKGSRHVRHILDDRKATFIMNRDYDDVKMIKTFLAQEDNFVIRF